jgi:hypothetical protein
MLLIKLKDNECVDACPCDLCTNIIIKYKINKIYCYVSDKQIIKHLIINK